MIVEKSVKMMSHAMKIYYFICLSFSPGSYTDSPGIEVIRRHVAEYIQRRDGIPAKWDDIILCAGASEGIRASALMKI